MEKKIALYSRTSTNLQDSGLEAQKRALMEYCKLHSIDDKNVIEYSDRGISGTKDSRPELNRMMKDCRAGKIGAVVVYSFSRFSRSTKHMIAAGAEFGEKNISFISLTDNVDTTTPMGKAFFTIIAALAQLQRDMIADSVRNGLKNAVAKGKILGRRPTARKKYDEVMILHSKGKDVREIARELNLSNASVYRAIAARQKIK